MYTVKIHNGILKCVHFCGIGGIGMSALAQALKLEGYCVQGSDHNTSGYIVDKLKSLDIPVFPDSEPSNLKYATLIVRSTAIKDSHTELQYAKTSRIPIIHRAELLSWILQTKYSITVSGTHGKSSTTYFIWELLRNTELSPTVINGAIINELNTNFIPSPTPIAVCEADESDGSFVNLPHNIAVTTNIEEEHLEYYKDLDEIKDAFIKYMENTHLTGYNVVNIDDPILATLLPNVHSPITYGLYHSHADILGYNIRHHTNGTLIDLQISRPLCKKLGLSDTGIENIKIALPGEHNIYNALGALTVALLMHIEVPILQSALTTCQGISRRFTKLFDNGKIKIFDDYAHHPTEVETTLHAAQNMADMEEKELIVVLQPHKYSRLQNCMNAFVSTLKDLKKLYIMPVYPAGELPLKGVSSEALAHKLSFHHKVKVVKDEIQLYNDLEHKHLNACIVVFLGAGDITNVANKFTEYFSDAYIKN